MKLRIKYTKTGPLRYISHLDVMRFFQKAIRRAGFDVSYTKGFSPHQIISFAAPMPLGMTSEGEYFDGEFNTVTNTADMVEGINATMPPYIQVLDIIKLEDKAKPSMSIVAASDYVVYDNPQSEVRPVSNLINKGFELPDELVALKKTKSGEKTEDIRPYIYGLGLMDTASGEISRWILKPEGASDRVKIVTPLEEPVGLYMLLSAGSINNLKPEAVLGGLAKLFDCPYSAGDERIHRLDTFMNSDTGFASLDKSGERF